MSDTSVLRIQSPYQHRRAAIDYPAPDNSADGKKPAPAASFKLISTISLVLAAFALIIYFIIGYIGAEIARAGHTVQTDERRIFIDADLITVRENFIRYRSQRQRAQVKKLELYLLWPDMEGYSEIRKSEFNNLEDNSKIIFVSLAPRFSTFDMSGRIEPIYSKFFKGEPEDIGFGLMRHELDKDAGFIDEYLVVQKNSPYPFSARCVRQNNNSLTPYCLRDIHIGKNLSLTYRFHEKLLSQWLALDQSIRTQFKSMIN